MTTRAAERDQSVPIGILPPVILRAAAAPPQLPPSWQRPVPWADEVTVEPTPEAMVRAGWGVVGIAVAGLGTVSAPYVWLAPDADAERVRDRVLGSTFAPPEVTVDDDRVCAAVSADLDEGGILVKRLGVVGTTHDARCLIVFTMDDLVAFDYAAPIVTASIALWMEDDHAARS